MYPINMTQETLKYARIVNKYIILTMHRYSVYPIGNKHTGTLRIDGIFLLLKSNLDLKTLLRVSDLLENIICSCSCHNNGVICCEHAF